MDKLLNYLASDSNAEIQYRSSGMQLAIHSDTTYISVSQARSRASGVHFSSKGPPNTNNPEEFIATINVIILVVCNIVSIITVRHHFFFHAQTAVLIRTTLTEMKWKHGPMTIQVDDFTAMGISTK